MTGFTNQQHIRNFRYQTVALAESNSTNARNTDVCFVFETKQNYSYIHGDTTAIDSVKVLDANGGLGRWISIGSVIEADNGLTRNGDIIELGGTLNRDTGVLQDGNNFAFLGEGGGTYNSDISIGTNFYPIGMFGAYVNQIWFKALTDMIFEAPVNEVKLANQPDGTIPLSVATVGFVDSRSHGIWDIDVDTGIATEFNPDEDRLRFFVGGIEMGGVREDGTFVIGSRGQEDASLSVEHNPAHSKAVNFRDKDGENIFTIYGSLAAGDSIFAMGDFENIAGGPYVLFDQANDEATFGGPVDGVRLTNQPTGAVDLAVATTKYVDDEVEAVAHWSKASNILYPTDSAVTGWEVENNHNGYTLCTLKNTDDTGNGAGAVMELKGSGTNYTNNVYFGIYGASFWIPLLAGAAALMTDKDINIGTVGTGKEMRFLTEGGYGSPNQMADGNIKGFHYTADLSGDNTADPRWIPDKGYVDVSILNATPTKETDRFTLTGTDITNNYIDLTQTPNIAQHIFVFYEGQHWDEGEDYNIVGTRITFTSTIVSGDKIVVKYFS